MKRVFCPACALLAILLICSAPALAAPFNYNFNFAGEVLSETVSSSSSTYPSNIAVNLAFDTDSGSYFGTNPYLPKFGTYVIDMQDVTLTVDGTPWQSIVPFPMTAQMFVIMDGKTPNAFVLDYVDTEGTLFTGTTKSAYFFAELDDKGNFILTAELLDSAWAAMEETKYDHTEASGILTPAATPIPGAAWLLGSGLVGLVGLRRRMRG